MAAGGGIQATVSATRDASLHELTHVPWSGCEGCRRRAPRQSRSSPGYGLEVEHEKRLLAVAAAAGAAVALDVVPTFLGAHTVPREYAR